MPFLSICHVWLHGGTLTPLHLLLVLYTPYVKSHDLLHGGRTLGDAFLDNVNANGFKAMLSLPLKSLCCLLTGHNCSKLEVYLSNSCNSTILLLFSLLFACMHVHMCITKAKMHIYTSIMENWCKTYITSLPVHSNFRAKDLFVF